MAIDTYMHKTGLDTLKWLCLLFLKSLSVEISKLKKSNAEFEI
jgi:hypothetical protein